MMPPFNPPSRALKFEVGDEIFRRHRTPQEHRILRWRIRGLPIHTARHVVHAGGVFAITAPGIAHVMKVVGPQHMPPEAQAGGMPLHSICAAPSPTSWTEPTSQLQW